MKNKTLTAKCRYCSKEIYSLYKGQLDYNILAHEISCPQKLKEESSQDNEKTLNSHKEKEQ